MISFDTFTGQLHADIASVSESSSGHSLSDLASDDTLEDFGAEALPRRVSTTEASHDVDALAAPPDNPASGNPYDLFHEHTPKAAVAMAPPQHSGGRRGRKHRKSSTPLPPPIIIPPVDEAHARDERRHHEPPLPQPEGSGGRVLQLFHLLTFKNQAGDAKSALVQRLVAVTNVKELIMSKATEEQIASAANDAITDEILASVDLEDKRRQSVTSSLLPSGAYRNLDRLCICTSALTRVWLCDAFTRRDRREPRNDRPDWALQSVPCAGARRRARLDHRRYGEAHLDERAESRAVLAAVAQEQSGDRVLQLLHCVQRPHGRPASVPDLRSRWSAPEQVVSKERVITERVHAAVESLPDAR